MNVLDGKRYKDIDKYLIDLWNLALNASENHNETVAKVAISLVQILQNMIKRMADPTLSPEEVRLYR